MRGLIFVSFICALVSGLPVNEIEKSRAKLLQQTRSINIRNAAFENILANLLETLRQNMLTGSGGLPVLDPYQLDHLDIEGAEVNLPGSHVTLSEIEVRHLSSFVIDKLSITRPVFWQIRYRVEVDAHIPVIEVLGGSYDAFIGVAGYTVFGKGDLKCNVKNVQVKVNLLVGTTINLSGIYLNIIESDVNFQLTAFEPTLTGVFNDAHASIFVNAFLSSLVPSLVTAYEDDISRVLSELVLRVGNDILSDINVIGIIGSL